MGVGALTETFATGAVRLWVTASPARLVTVSVKLLAEVRLAVETACPLVTEPRVAIWPVPRLKTGVMVPALP